jgi:hypothetical protein
VSAHSGNVGPDAEFDAVMRDAGYVALSVDEVLARVEHVIRAIVDQHAAIPVVVAELGRAWADEFPYDEARQFAVSVAVGVACEALDVADTAEAAKLVRRSGDYLLGARARLLERFGHV